MTAERTETYKVHGPLTELTRARVHELTREPEAVFWVFVFPIVLTAVLGLAFRSKPPEPLPVGVVAGQLGFDDASNFVKFFRREAGCVPSEFRRRSRAGGATAAS